MLCSMIIFERGKRYSMYVGANVGGFYSRLAALSRLHSRMHLCSWQCGTESRTRVFAMEKHLFLVFSFLCQYSLFFPPECHHFGTFFPAFPSCSFFLLCAVYRPAEKLLKKWHLPLSTLLSHAPISSI